jgi:hypothetical protein
MWDSREIARVIMLGVASFIYTVFVGQLGNMITGILGLNYFFVFGHAILISLSFLIYQGRRWRFFLQGVLVAVLTLPTFMTGMPFDVLSKWPMIAGSFLADVIFNSLYSFFNNRKQLFLWAFVSVFGFFIISPFLAAQNMLLFYPPQVFTTYITVYFLLFPVTIIELIIGSLIGHRIYGRINKSMK